MQRRTTFLICTTLLLAFLGLGVANVGAQDVAWKKNFGGNGKDYYSAITTVSDGIVAVGYSDSFDNGDWAGVTGKGSDDAIIVKHDHSGNVVWKKNFGGGYSDVYWGVTAVSDGIVAVGYSQAGSFGNGDWAGVTGKGDNDAIIVKYDNAGNVVWKKNFGGNGDDSYWGVTTVADGYVAVGVSSFASFGTGDWDDVAEKGGIDAIIVKYDNDGNVVWKKNLGGDGADGYNSITTVSDGIVAVGSSGQSSFDNGDWMGVTGKGSYDAIIVKYDHSGDVVWKKNFGGSDIDEYFSVTTVSDGIVAVGRSAQNSFGNGDWAGVTGKGNNDAIIVKYDNDGNAVWEKNFGGNDTDYYSTVTTVSDGIVAAGYSGAVSFGTGDWMGVTGKGGQDAIIVKYDHSGDVVWKKYFGGNGAEDYYSVTTVSDGIVAVGYSGAVSFGNGDWAGVAGKGDQDAIIVKYLEISPSSVSNTHANFSCPAGQVTVTYDLISALPVDVTLYYSHNKRDWLIAQTVSGDLFDQTTGTGKTIIWNNYDDNVRFGKFYFKVVMPEPPEPECEGVVINGVCWATRNVDMPGTFAANPEDAGMFYQWNRNIGWSSTDPMINSNGGTTWDNTNSTGTTWEVANDPSPAGWRVPTLEELESLGTWADQSKVTKTWDATLKGMLLTDVASGASLFLPAAGGSSNGSLGDAGAYGYYWSSTQNGSYNAYFLYFLSNYFLVSSSYRSYGFSVRCVAE